MAAERRKCYACESDPSECSNPDIYCNPPRPQCNFSIRTKNGFSEEKTLCCKCQNKLFDSPLQIAAEVVSCSSTNDECDWLGKLKKLDKHRTNPKAKCKVKAVSLPPVHHAVASHHHQQTQTDRRTDPNYNVRSRGTNTDPVR